MPPLTRSSTWKSLGEPSSPKNKLKLHNKKLGPKPVQGTMPPCYCSPEFKNRTPGCPEGCLVRRVVSRNTTTLPISERRPGLSIKQIGESALSDYNKQHGTDLEYVRPLDDKDRSMGGPGITIDFHERHAYWKHFNFEARRRNADPSGKPLLLFAEVFWGEEKFVLTSLMQVEPTDGAMGCQKCRSNISHPRHGFRAGFYNKGEESKLLSEQEAADLSKFALQDYNEKHGTKLKFERASSCNSFKSTGVLMDFSKKKTSWVHMNFEARRVGRNGEEEVVGLFAELYLGDDEKYVLSTLSRAEPSNVRGKGEWKKKMKIDQGLCCCCPNEKIYHTWRGFRYAYNDPPWRGFRNDPPLPDRT